MRRRGLFMGTSAMAAVALMRRDGGARAQTCPPASPSTTRPPPAQVCVGTTETAVPDAFFTDTLSNSLNARKICFAPGLSAITDIVLAFPGFGLNNPEQDLPCGYTVTASVEYPLGSPPRQVFFNGQPSAQVAAGRVIAKSDPLPVTIPNGAAFAVKTHATWSCGVFWLAVGTAAQMIGEWTVRGTNLPDLTLDTSAQTTTSQLAGFGPVVYGTLATPTAAVALIGDSWGTLSADWVDPNVGYNAWGRAMRGLLPFVNLARGGDSAVNYFQRPEGRNLLLRDKITHCIWEMGANDLFGGANIATLIGDLQTATAPFLDRGVRCYAMTLTPRSASTDGWSTSAHQTPASLAVEAVRVPYNAWLRANWQSIGLSGVFDVAHAIDPNDMGVWGFDPNPPAVVGISCSGFATVQNGSVATVSLASYNMNSSSGGPYPPGGVSFPCVVVPYPNTGGSGAVVNAITDPVKPFVQSFTVVNGGSGYGYPPMVSTAGPWTNDGVHANSRGWDQVLTGCANLAPETFLS